MIIDVIDHIRKLFRLHEIIRVILNIAKIFETPIGHY